jgi:hypothetical protein
LSGLTGSGFGLDILEETRVVPTNNGDHDKFSHYVHKDDMMHGMVYGQAIMALCGKVWVPEQEGSKYPVCPDCKEIYNSIPSGGEGDGE